VELKADAEAASTDRKGREAAIRLFLADAVLGAHAMRV
jgi:hypothetical protein